MKEELGSLPKSTKIDRCTRCGKGPIVVDSSGGEMNCSNCCYVIVDKIEEEGPEWRAFSKD